MGAVRWYASSFLIVVVKHGLVTRNMGGITKVHKVQIRRCVSMWVKQMLYHPVKWSRAYRAKQLPNSDRDLYKFNE